jgi:CRP-like cAMP-binding protein
MAGPVSQNTVRNRLLRCMAAEDFALLQPHLEPVGLPGRTTVESPGKPIESACFVESGICSIIVIGGNDEQSEVGHVGREGMSGRAILLGSRRPSNQMLVQVSGTALAIGAVPLLDAMERSRSLRNLLFRYVQTVDVQVAHTILAATRFNVHQRLARWLLMCHDRLDGNDLPLTHELLSLMLSVRRASVTQEIQVLEGLGAVRATRGNIRIVDRARLAQLTAGCYGIPEREYDKLIQPARAPETRSAASR